MVYNGSMEMPEIKALKPPKFWNRPATKHYGIRTNDVHRLYGDSYRVYKSNKMDSQAQSFVDAKKSADMPSSWCGTYKEPKFLTDNYISMRMPITSKDRIAPLPRPSISTSSITLPAVATDYSLRQSHLSTQYDHRYLGGVKSTKLGGSSDSYYRLEEKFARL